VRAEGDGRRVVRGCVGGRRHHVAAASTARVTSLQHHPAFEQYHHEGLGLRAIRLHGIIAQHQSVYMFGCTHSRFHTALERNDLMVTFGCFHYWPASFHKPYTPMAISIPAGTVGSVGNVRERDARRQLGAPGGGGRRRVVVALACGTHELVCSVAEGQCQRAPGLRGKELGRAGVGVGVLDGGWQGGGREVGW
jgi:hypothetical protein